MTTTDLFCPLLVALNFFPRPNTYAAIRWTKHFTQSRLHYELSNCVLHYILLLFLRGKLRSMEVVLFGALGRNESSLCCFLSTVWEGDTPVVHFRVGCCTTHMYTCESRGTRLDATSGTANITFVFVSSWYFCARRMEDVERHKIIITLLLTGPGKVTVANKYRPENLPGNLKPYCQRVVHNPAQRVVVRCLPPTHFHWY